jgi:hypothetical protein
MTATVTDRLSPAQRLPGPDLWSLAAVGEGGPEVDLVEVGRVHAAVLGTTGIDIEAGA